MTEKPRRQFYGRRKGRPVRVQKQKLLDRLLPSLRLSLQEGDANIEPQSFFAVPPKEVWLEIGFGGGEHLAELAFRNPDVGFIGSEVFLNGVASFLEHHEEKKLSNVRLFPDDVRLLLKTLKPQSLHKVMVLFPDPWPKARHNKRRLVQKETLEILSNLLIEGGELRLASDHKDYVAWMLEEIEKVPSLVFSEDISFEGRQKRPSSWPATRYEEKAAKKGITSTYLSLTKRA